MDERVWEKSVQPCRHAARAFGLDSSRPRHRCKNHLTTRQKCDKSAAESQLVDSSLNGACGGARIGSHYEAVHVISGLQVRQLESVARSPRCIVESMIWSDINSSQMQGAGFPEDALQVDHQRVKGFFAGDKIDPVLLGRVAAVFVGYFAGDAIFAIVGRPFLSTILSLVIDGLGAIAVIKLLFLIVGLRRRVAERRYHELLKAKTKAALKLIRIAFNRSGLRHDDLLDVGGAQMLDAEMTIALQWLRAAQPRLAQAETLLAKSAVFFGRKRIDARLRFVVCGRDIRAEYSPVTIFIVFLTDEALVVYEAEVDLVSGDARKEGLTRFLLRDIADVSAYHDAKRLVRGPGGETFEKCRRETHHRAREIVCREHSIRITKTGGLHLDIAVGGPQYQTADAKTSGRHDWHEDRLALLSEAVARRINDARTLERDRRRSACPLS